MHGSDFKLDKLDLRILRILQENSKITNLDLSKKIFVLVSLAWQKPNALDNFISKVKNIDEITECYIITGEADFLMKIVCKDIPTYEHLLFKTLSQIEEIERLKTLMTLSTIKDSKVLPFGNE